MSISPEFSMKQERKNNLVLVQFLCCSGTITHPSALLSVKQMYENREKKSSSSSRALVTSGILRGKRSEVFMPSF